ncbi:MAG TPA: hypothetical protein VLF67_02465 [Candidatus Saccharimonas sp.]|nr:hypothetical protein [Candidatus Saccharimonas sp.]
MLESTTRRGRLRRLLDEVTDWLEGVSIILIFAVLGAIIAALLVAAFWQPVAWLIHTYF